MTVSHVESTLSGIISELSKTPWLFLRNPAKDFTRRRKLCFRDVVFLLLSMEAKSTTNELLDFFKCAVDMPTPSALRQQRDKIEFLFREFADMRDDTALYRGYRLLAADGSDLTIAPDPSYYPGANGQKHYGLLHLNALYDLQQKTYVDALVQKSRKANEQRALCDMVDRLQEIFARLTMYNFAERITACVVIRRGNKKHTYQVNFSAAVHICREFLCFPYFLSAALCRRRS